MSVSHPQRAPDLARAATKARGALEWGVAAAGGAWGAALIAATLALAALLLAFRQHLAGLGGLGYAGVFAIAVLGNAPVVPVFPWLVLVAPLSGLYSTWGIVLAGAAGAGVGEVLPYLVGGRIARSRAAPAWVSRLVRLPRWLRWAAVLAISLSPAFSFPGLAAGLVRLPFWAMTAIKVATEAVKLWLVVGAAVLAKELLLGGW